MHARAIGRTTTLAALATVLVSLANRSQGADAASTAPTVSERVAYWLDRLVTGPEPSATAIPSFQHGLLMDAERNLAAAPDETLARLSDDALRLRVQENPNIDPWMGILSVLGRIGDRLGPARRPIARAWAAPALEHRELVVRRQGLSVLMLLEDPVDAPAIVRAFRRDAGDRLISVGAVKALIAMGPPFSGEAARVVLESGVADARDGSSSVWDLFVPATLDAKKGDDDLLAWWALLTGSAGPRARPRAKRSATTDDPRHVLGFEEGLTSSKFSTVAALVELAKRGHPPALAWARAAVAAGDPIARGAFPTGDRPALTDLVARAEGLALRFTTPPLPTVGEVLALIRALRDREEDASARALSAVLEALPVTTTWQEAVFACADALWAKSVDLRNYVDRLIRSGDAERIKIGLLLARRSRDPRFIELLEQFLAQPGLPVRVRNQLRREIANLYGVGALSRGIEPERVSVFAKSLAQWVADPADPSGRGLAGSLLDLGAAGQAAFAQELRGAHREAYVGALESVNEKYVDAEVIAALLDPVTDEMPAPDRQHVWNAVFRAAPQESAGVLEATAARLRPPAKDEALTLLRIVSNRVTVPR